MREIELDAYPTVDATVPVEQATAMLRSSDEDYLLFLDEQRRPTAWVDMENLNDPSTALDAAGLSVVVRLEPEDTLRDAVEQMLHSATGAACVVDSKGAYLGVMRLEAIMQVIGDMQEAARRHVAEKKAAERS